MMFRILSFAVLVGITLPSIAQTPETAAEYMAYLADREEALSKSYLSYMSESAHGNRARKLEKRRQELIAAIRKSLTDATRLKPFKGDASLRDGYKHYWDILLKVFNEDYHKIVNMEEIAEQSYDNMEAYLMAQEKAGEVLHDAQTQLVPVFKSFAARNNITLVESESKMSKKMKQVGDVNSYYHHLFLIFFKNQKQEAYMIDALNKKDINAVEQNRMTLLRFADEGMKNLDTLKAFSGDASLITNCRKVLEFLKSEAQKDVPLQNDFLVKSNEFEKVRKAFEAKAPAKRTQTDVDNYNKVVNEVNAALTANNKSLESLNKNRDKAYTNWNNAVEKFMATHVPRSR